MEANVFTKLLSVFYDTAEKGKDAELKKALNKKNDPAFDKAYDVWKKDGENLLLATKRLLQRSGSDTQDVDALLKRYHNY